MRRILALAALAFTGCVTTVAVPRGHVVPKSSATLTTPLPEDVTATWNARDTTCPDAARALLDLDRSIGDLALRGLSSGLAERGQSVPAAYAVRLRQEGIELLLSKPTSTTDPVQPPAPWFTAADGRSWKYFGLVNDCAASLEPTTLPFTFSRLPPAWCGNATEANPVIRAG